MKAAAPQRSVRIGWAIAVALAVALRVWNALASPVLRGYDAWGHVSYALFLDLYRAVPYADQGWSYFHPPLHYLFGLLLAQAGDATVLVRGLGLVSSAASLGTAGLAGWLVRAALPQRPWLPLLAFVAVAFVPVHVYTSPMPGNEQTAAFLSSLGIALFVRNQLRSQPTRRGDLATGLVLGLALLSKFSGLLPLLAALATLALGALRRPAGWSRALRRGAVLSGVALLVCAPYYARNLATFGTPFQLSRDTPLVARVESAQPPQQRSWRDLVTPSPRALVDPDVRAPHLLHSIWGSAYVHAWHDARPATALLPKWRRDAPLWLGLVPTGLALAGFALSLRRARASEPDLALGLLTLLNLGAFAVMAYRVPTWAMLKASYLLQLSLPFGLYLARALDALARGGRPRTARAAGAWVALTAGVVALAHVSPGRGGENARMAAAHLHFGNVERARALLEPRLAQSVKPGRRVWLTETLAASLLLAGDPARARQLYAQARDAAVGDAPQLEDRDSPWVTNRLAVATALAGDRSAARTLLEGELARARLPELLVNRGALRARAGDLSGAESDLREALARDASLAPAWRNLGWILARRGAAPSASQASQAAERLSSVAPRGFPYGVGDGFHTGGQRFMLVLEADGLALYRPARARGQ